MQETGLQQEAVEQKTAVSILPETPTVEATSVDDTAQSATLSNSFILLKRHAKRRRRMWKIFWTVWTVMMLGGGLANWSHANLYVRLCSDLLIIGAVLIMLSMIPSLIITSRRVRAAMRDMTMMDDLSVIGPLLESSEGTNGRLPAEAVVALAHLFPRLKANDAHLLSDRQRKMLYRFISNPMYLATNLTNGTARERDAYVEFVLAALKALEQIGDAAALRPVETIAAFGELIALPTSGVEGIGGMGIGVSFGEQPIALPPSGPIPFHGPGLIYRRLAAEVRMARIKEAARECLPALRERIEQHRSQDGLLRPSSVSEAAVDTLVRPAQAKQETAPEQLLRPDRSGSS